MESFTNASFITAVWGVGEDALLPCCKLTSKIPDGLGFFCNYVFFLIDLKHH